MAKEFDADAFMESWTPDLVPEGNDLRNSIIKAFGLKPDDNYVYHAMTSVTLSEVQHAIECGANYGFHNWYSDVTRKLTPPPSPTDIAAYTSIFSMTTSTTKSLTTFMANAKKLSIRAQVAANLISNLATPSPSSNLTLPPKMKNPPPNPYYDYWSWSCQELEWAGPMGVAVHQSHHILPVFYHHFGCLCPSFDALSLIYQLAVPKTSGGKKPANGPNITKPVLEVGSGNGYWAYLLRQTGITVHCVDNGASLWRIMWIKDTIRADGTNFVKRPPSQYNLGKGASNAILLLVYPQVSADFTGKVLRAYEGDTIVVAGTQNANRFTSFANETIEEWMNREKKEFEKVCQVPLPSFAGKDEAIYIFRRKAE